ncbi:MAG: ion transporter [Muribaculaceae bacterium]
MNRLTARRIVKHRAFELAIIAVIIINAVFIGVESYGYDAIINTLQTVILGIFTAEILLRYIASDGVKAFFSNGWNIFDLTLVVIGYIPESIFSGSSWVLAIRVVRVFRVLRLLRTLKEVKLIITALTKSISSLFYNAVFFFIFLYLFAIIGVALFRLPERCTLTPQQQEVLAQLEVETPQVYTARPDPFGNLGEALFTLFRELTGDDWAALRYNQITASEHGLISASPTVITAYHIVWFVLSACLLLNLVVGAIVNNYQISMDETEAKKDKA